MSAARGLALALTLVVGGALPPAAAAVDSTFEARDAAWQLGALRWCEAGSEDEASKARYTEVRTFVAGVVAKAVEAGHLSEKAAAGFAKAVEEDAELDGEPLDRERCEELAHDLEIPDPPRAPSPDPPRAPAAAPPGSTPGEAGSAPAGAAAPDAATPG